MSSLLHGRNEQVKTDAKGANWVEYTCRTSHGDKDRWRKFLHRVEEFSVFEQSEFPFIIYIRTKEKRLPNPTFLAKIPEQTFNRFVYVGFHGLNRLRNYAQERGLI